MSDINVRGAPKTRATSIRLKEVLALHIGPQRARSIVEHLTAIELRQGYTNFLLGNALVIFAAFPLASMIEVP
jgi:hypothetical protein